MKRYLSIGVVLLLHLSLLDTPALSAPKEGSKCTSVGKLSGKLTCVSLDGKKFWYEITLAKGVKKYAQINTDCYRENLITKGYDSSKKLVQLTCKYPTSVQGSEPPKWVISQVNQNGQKVGEFVFDQICYFDPLVPKEWADVEKWAKSQIGCARPYRYVKSEINSTPKSAITSPNSSVESCKLPNNSQSTRLRWTGFPRTSAFQNFTKSAVFQVVPVEFSDYKANSDPSVDFKKYFDFYTEYLKNASDIDIKPIFKTPKKYYSLSKNIDHYDIEFGDGKNFIQEIFEVTKNELSYSGVDMILIVVPPSVPADIFFAGGLSWGEVQSPQGPVKNVYVLGPISLSARNKPFSSIAGDPWIFIHEAIGHHSGLNDHLGDGKGALGHIGMGGWGQMAGINGDFLVWDKWLIGFIGDNQIACVTESNAQTYWVRPNSIKNNGIKGMVIPIKEQQAIVIESQRSTGYHFKIPKKFDGALIYKIDTSVQVNDLGALLLNTENITYDGISGMRYGDATLKLGKSYLYSGWKISVIESGDFGDVVKVEKVA